MTPDGHINYPLDTSRTQRTRFDNNSSLRAIIPFASRAIRGGIRRELLSAVMGHSEEQVTTQVYRNLMDDSFGDTLKVLHSVENGLGRQ